MKCKGEKQATKETGQSDQSQQGKCLIENSLRFVFPVPAPKPHVLVNASLTVFSYLFHTMAFNYVAFCFMYRGKLIIS